MTQVQIRVKTDLSGLARIQAAFGGRGSGGGGITAAAAAGGAGGTGGATGQPRKMFRQWAKRYEAFARRRFDRYSKGGGDWRPLALSTIKARARRLNTHGKKKRDVQVFGRGRAYTGKAGSIGLAVHRGELVGYTGIKVAILADTGLMKQAMGIGSAGNLLQDIPAGVRYGFAGTAHPGGSTISQIAGYHNVGGGNNRPPQRVILVQPDQETVGLMIGDLARCVRELGQIAGSRGAGGAP